MINISSLRGGKMDQKYDLEDRNYDLDTAIGVVREILYASSNPHQAKSIQVINDNAKRILDAIAGPGD